VSARRRRWACGNDQAKAIEGVQWKIPRLREIDDAPALGRHEPRHRALSLGERLRHRLGIKFAQQKEAHAEMQGRH
jgi:hypothetical protein